jgi:hypothetical protein
MTDNVITIRSPAAQGRDEREPDRVHCGRCGDENLVATLMIMPLSAPEGDASYTTATCEVCTQRILDVLVNPHLLISAVSRDDEEMTAEILLDGTGIGRADAIQMLINAAEMLNTGEAESVIHYDEDEATS